MKRSPLVVVVSLIAGVLALDRGLPVRAQVETSRAEVCAVYVNTADVVVSPTTDTRYDAQAEVPVPVPAGAVGIDSWQFGAEMEPGTKVRALLFLRSNGPLSHFAARDAAQSAFIRPGAPIELQPGAAVILRARFFNEAEDGAPQVARGNVWVYFLMAEGYD